VVFTAEDPAGPWSDGVTLDLSGIDPDLAWDDDGTCYVTYSGFDATFTGTQHLGILQARVDLDTGEALEKPRSLWSGTGGQYPEAPHLYRVDDRWYLLIAEGGTERGHAVSLARSSSPSGPFEPCPVNPLLTARGTSRTVQCTGHGDLFQTHDGQWMLVHLGTWTLGLAYRFAPLGRETFLTEVTWDDEWPRITPLAADVRTPLAPFVDDFDGDALGPDWIGIRRLPGSFARVEAGALVLDGEGRSMDDRLPTFVGKRVTRVRGRIAAVVEAGGPGTVGGLSLRYDERLHLDLERQHGRVVARTALSTIRQEHAVDVSDGPVELGFELRAPHPRSVSSDLIDLVVVQGGDRQVLTTVDGRFMSVEVAGSFTGRVAGAYCTTGQIRVTRYEENDESTG
jgi:beta-xylosidase